jgi:tRNA wybutosine-synthesizing protein 3
LEDSQHVLAAALGSGFRESGAVSLTPSRDGEINPMVAVRSSGYSFDAIIGYQSDTGKNIALVDETYLQTLFNIANDRFRVNSERIKRFEVALHEQYHPESIPRADVNKPEWEAADVRKQRKREEGLARQRAIRENHGVEDADVES